MRTKKIIKEIKKYHPADMSDAELRQKTEEFKERLADGETLDQILPEAYAVVREAAFRVLGMRHYEVQLIGGILLHQGKVAEMKTGEGKTLVATLPAYLNALTGEGVFVITVNDYLAKRDAETMGKVHEFLGLTVGVVLNGMSNKERKDAYACDITYVTNNEMGFDYLRDNMAVDKEERVQRGLHYAIIDEADSVLIDEARTPLIISGESEKSTRLYEACDVLVHQLERGEAEEFTKMNAIIGEEAKETGDYVVDEKEKTVNLTASGIRKAEEFFGIENLSDSSNIEIQRNIILALKANNLMHKDKDYVVDENGEVLIVDEFTGRIMQGRRYSDGLHQAIEAKEHVPIKNESKSLATITFQSLFNKFDKKCGMTGTGVSDAKEFKSIYKMDTVAVPTCRPVIRKDLPDVIYRTKKEKFRAVVREVMVAKKKGQPVLVGTATIEDSERLSAMLMKKRIKHNVLNAKNNQQEAEIVAQAGTFGAVTIATNMAGRGTDIKLDKRAKKAGGLYVIGTQRHDSRRVDDQLRGRSGRQGDPGKSQFFLSLEDDLFKLFASDRIKRAMDVADFKKDEPIQHRILTKAVRTAQKRVEGNNFMARKRLLDYDEVMNEQREIIYEERRRILEGKSVRDVIWNMLDECVGQAVSAATVKKNEWDLDILNRKLKALIPSMEPVTEVHSASDVAKIVHTAYEMKEGEYPEENVLRGTERIVLLKTIDSFWTQHIDDLLQLKQGIGLQAYGQKDPVTEYKMEAYKMFSEMTDRISEYTIRTLFRLRVVFEDELE